MVPAILLLALASGAAPQATVTAIQDRIARSDLTGARAQLEAALRAYPDDGGLYNLQGIIAAQRNEYAAAEAAFRKAVRLAPGLTGAWLNLGRLYQTHAGTEPEAARKGIEVYRRVLAARPDFPEANYQLAVLLEHEGAFRESLVRLDRLPAGDRERTGALAVRCADLAGLGNRAAAREACGRLLAHTELHEDDVMAVLPALEKAGLAREMLEGLAERKLASGAGLARLAAIYEGAGELARARAAFESAAQAGGRPAVGPLLDLARVAWKQKDYEGTLGYLAHARDLDPGNAGIHFFFGVTANEMKLAAEARKSLEKALELAPENPYYNYALGVLHLQWTDKRGAVPYLKRYTAARPEDPRGRLALATAHFLLNEFEEARREITGVKGEAAEYLMARIAREEGDAAEAERRLRAALALAPEMADARADLGVLLFDKEDYEGARRETEAALKADPESYIANRTLMQLYARAKDPRAAAQAERLKTLVEDRNKRTQMMLRTIEVRPY